MDLPIVRISPQWRRSPPSEKKFPDNIERSAWQVELEKLIKSIWKKKLYSNEIRAMLKKPKLPMEARLQPNPFRVSVCAARTLNATGQSRVTLSLRQEH